MTTFGFESEWAQGGPELVAHLHSLGHLPDSYLHSYHCDCDFCDFTNPDFALRAQRDSTCSAELISSPFANLEDAAEVFKVVQDASIEVDAEPGLNAGFHVHVARPESGTGRTSALHAFLKWEETLRRLAGGRWRLERGFNTPTVQQALGYVPNYCFGEGLDGDILARWNEVRYYPDLNNPSDFLDKNLSGEALREHRRGMRDWVYEADRHSNLCTNTRHRTWEFRLWNSTRSAWRMELWCRMSVALVKTRVAEALELVAPEERDPITLAEIVSVEDDRLAELVLRQASYLERVTREGEPVVFALAT